MFPFSKLPPSDSSEQKALLVAVACSLGFIVFLTVVRPSNWTRTKLSRVQVQIPSKKLFPASPPPVRDPLDQYRIKPKAFYQTDFWNFSYGLYTLPDGKGFNLSLINSEMALPDSRDLFSLKDVYYRDVTGDGEPEAIVWLSHVSCGGSCDGGSNLFYIYSVANSKLKPIWRHETGSYAYGCGLKSFTLSGRQIVLELFGNCTKNEKADPGDSKFIVKGSTYIFLEYDGRRFAQRSVEFVNSPETNVMNFEPGIRIF